LDPLGRINDRIELTAQATCSYQPSIFSIRPPDLDMLSGTQCEVLYQERETKLHQVESSDQRSGTILKGNTYSSGIFQSPGYKGTDFLCVSGSQPGTIFGSPRNHLAMSGDIFGCQNWGV